MKRVIVLGTVVALTLGASPIVAGQTTSKMTTAQVKEAVIRQSIARYPGVCACPYSVTRSGRRCGRRSAYSKPGGYAPKCYPQDVSRNEVEAWRRRVNQSRGDKS